MYGAPGPVFGLWLVADCLQWVCASGIACSDRLSMFILYRCLK